MALANTTDFGVAVNQIFWYMDNVFGGIDNERLPIFSGMLPEDYKTLKTAYDTYKKARLARPTSIELAPNAHGANGTTAYRG